MAELFANRARSTLAGAIDADDTSLAVQSSDASEFSAPTGGDYGTLVIEKADDRSVYEILTFTGRSSGTLSGLTRGAQGSTARAWSADDVIGQVASKDALDRFEAKPTQAELSAAVAAEATARGTADTTLGGSIASEASTRSAADAALAGDIAAEATARANADTAEAGTRGAADTTLQSNIDAKAPSASPTLTGTVSVPDSSGGDNSARAANTRFVAAAIAALVNSSPSALDTLKELSDALGADPNFATTITNALAAKAPLASPALTGQASVTAGSAAHIPLTVKGAASQSGNHFEVRTSSNTLLAYIQFTGGIISTATSAFPFLKGSGPGNFVLGLDDGTYALKIFSVNAARVILGVTGAASQSADIARFMDSASANLLAVTAAGNLTRAGTQVVSTRRTGWTAGTGTATRTTFDTATATLADIAERLKALIDDLIAHGLIGT